MLFPLWPKFFNEYTHRRKNSRTKKLTIFLFTSFSQTIAILETFLLSNGIFEKLKHHFSSCFWKDYRHQRIKKEKKHTKVLTPYLKRCCCYCVVWVKIKVLNLYPKRRSTAKIYSFLFAFCILFKYHNCSKRINGSLYITLAPYCSVLLQTEYTVVLFFFSIYNQFFRKNKTKLFSCHFNSKCAQRTDTLAHTPKEWIRKKSMKNLNRLLTINLWRLFKNAESAQRPN